MKIKVKNLPGHRAVFSNRHPFWIPPPSRRHSRNDCSINMWMRGAIPRKGKDEQTSQQMCSPKEDRPLPLSWGWGGKGESNNRKGKKIKCIYWMFVISSYCWLAYAISFPGHTLDKWLLTEIGSTLLRFPLCSAMPISSLCTSLLCPPPSFLRYWALADCQLFLVLHCMAQANNQSRTNKGSFPWYRCLQWQVLFHNNKWWIWLVAERHRLELQSQLSHQVP